MKMIKHNKTNSMLLTLLLSLLLSSSLAVLRQDEQQQQEQDAANANDNGIHRVINGRRLLAGNYTALLDENHPNFSVDGGVDHASGEHFERQTMVFHPNFAGPGNEQGRVFDVGTPHYGGTGCA